MIPVTMPRSREVAVSVDGRDYRVFVAWPAEPPPPSGYPVFYVLDANAAFATVVEAVRMRSHRPDATLVQPSLVVGVAYPGDGPYERVRRTFDYTQAGSGPVQADGGDGRAAAAVGGGPRFLEFLTRELPALIASEWPIDRARRTIIGHSLAGYFVLHTLVISPGSFDTYVAISPSIWWDRPGLTAAARSLASRRAVDSQAANVFITVGEYEQKLAPWQVDKPRVGTVAERREDRRMVDQAREFAAELGAGANLHVAFRELPEQDHASVVPLSISEALRIAFRR